MLCAAVWWTLVLSLGSARDITMCRTPGTRDVMGWLTCVAPCSRYPPLSALASTWLLCQQACVRLRAKLDGDTGAGAERLFSKSMVRACSRGTLNGWS